LVEGKVERVIGIRVEVGSGSNWTTVNTSANSLARHDSLVVKEGFWHFFSMFNLLLIPMENKKYVPTLIYST
jgi:hypothetical protein